MEEPSRLHLGSGAQTASVAREISNSEAMGGKACWVGFCCLECLLFCFVSGQNDLANHTLPGASSYMFFKYAYSFSVN